jgi:3-deoxy-7-phosphoheptulonate synthase
LFGDNEMIISMRPHATRQEIDHVCERIREFGYKVHSIEGEERVVIGVVGVGDVTACLESLEATPGVESAMRISAPYKFVSREFKKERSVIRVNGVEVGGGEFVVIAGPCSVESEKQIMETAEGVAAAGARILRGGAFKPRTSPYDFQGLELEGPETPAPRRKEATGLAIVTEVMSEQRRGSGCRACGHACRSARATCRISCLLKSLGVHVAGRFC